MKIERFDEFVPITIGIEDLNDLKDLKIERFDEFVPIAIGIEDWKIGPDYYRD